MRVALNMSRQTYEYWKNYNLSRAADVLLEMYDITSLPPANTQREVERSVNITNEDFIELYHRVGARSKFVSVARLFAFGAEADVAATDAFKERYRATEPEIEQAREERDDIREALIVVRNKLREAILLGANDDIKELARIVAEMIEGGTYK